MLYMAGGGGACSAHGVMDSCKIVVGNPLGDLNVNVKCRSKLCHGAVGCGGFDWVQAAQNCVKWQYLHVTQNAGNFQSSMSSISNSQ
jgi:hypothetical protein